MKKQLFLTSLMSVAAFSAQATEMENNLTAAFGACIGSATSVIASKLCYRFYNREETRKRSEKTTLAALIGGAGFGAISAVILANYFPKALETTMPEHLLRTTGKIAFATIVSELGIFFTSPIPKK